MYIRSPMSPHIFIPKQHIAGKSYVALRTNIVSWQLRRY